MSLNKKWRNQFQRWKDNKESDEVITRLLRRHRKLNIDLEVVQNSLSQIHRHVDKYLLDPRLLPLELLLHPESWSPSLNGINTLACLNNHRQLTSIEDLLTSGILNNILQGELSLYEDLPPIPIRAYQEGLNANHRQYCRINKISALEHLATEGWQNFRNGRPVATGLDRYLAEPPQQFQSVRYEGVEALLVLDGTVSEAQHLAVRGGWNKAIACGLNDLQSLQNKLSIPHLDQITICHAKDIPAVGSGNAIREALNNTSQKGLLTCDDIITYKKFDDSEGYEHRQYRSALSAWRLYTRGAIGGLLTVPVEILRSFSCQNTYTCLEAFRLDLLLGSNIRQLPKHHIAQPLIRSPIKHNPVLPELGWPAERRPFNEEQLAEIELIRNRHARHELKDGGELRQNAFQSGCHNITYRRKDQTLISILIPFRDQVHLTRICLESIQINAGQTIPYEIILIDNGSVKTETKEWIKSIILHKNISCITINESFNFSRLNNRARQISRGNYLLFLNNDIEFRSNNILQDLLDPFAHPDTAAVGAKLHYPDMSIQHQGVVIIPGERRCVLQPGKHLYQQEIIDSLLPLNTQEEFSAASAACLMVRTDSFDEIGGFDEKLAVVFNDVDLCLRLRETGGRVVVIPQPNIIHHESISRGKDYFGDAWIRFQRESGRLRYRHRLLYQQGDSLINPLLHHHSNRYEPAPPPEKPLGYAREQILLTWFRPEHTKNFKPPLIFAQFSADPNTPVRADILDLLKEYRRYYYVQVVAATPAILEKPQSLRALKKVCDGIIIRQNEGYDYGSWMTGIRICRKRIEQQQQLVLCNDSFWGPVRPLKYLINRLHKCTADVVGLTDNLMYEPHLQSAFLMFKKKAISCQKFWDFWDEIQCWRSKRMIVKNYEVGLPVLLKNEGLNLKSLYSTNANGNILHSEWKELIENQNFPFIKVSLLRDNPHGIDTSHWKSVVSSSNRKLAREIENQTNISKTLGT